MQDYNSKDINKSYIGKRPDILKVLPSNPLMILDVGCSTGSFGGEIKKVFPSAKVFGVELDKNMAKLAQKKLDKVICDDVEKLKFEEYFEQNSFDCIIFADILEHLKNPWSVLKAATNLLTSDGCIVLSMPNVKHYTTILHLIFLGEWPYRKRGIHDRTHLRFFTIKNIRKLLRYAGLKIEKININYRLVDLPCKLNFITKIFYLPIVKHFFAYQYIIRAKKRRTEFLA